MSPSSYQLNKRLLVISLFVIVFGSFFAVDRVYAVPPCSDNNQDNPNTKTYIWCAREAVTYASGNLTIDSGYSPVDSFSGGVCILSTDGSASECGYSTLQGGSATINVNCQEQDTCNYAQVWLFVPNGVYGSVILEADDVVPPPVVIQDKVYVNLNFNVTDGCNAEPISNASVGINQDFGNGTDRTTDVNGFTQYSVIKDANVGWGVSRSGYGSASGGVLANSNPTNQNVILTRECGGPPPDNNTSNDPAPIPDPPQNDSPDLYITPSSQEIEIGEIAYFQVWYDPDGSGPDPIENFGNNVSAWASNNTSIATYEGVKQPGERAQYLGQSAGDVTISAWYGFGAYATLRVNAPTHTLTVSIASGSGTITGPGINCPGDCTQNFDSDTWVTLTATPASGYIFNSWTTGSGKVCGGQDSVCSALINGDLAANANFTLVPLPFDYILSNSGASSATKANGNVFTQNTITKTLTSGTGAAVDLVVSGIPSGVEVNGISNQGCAPTCTSVVTFKVSKDAPVGTFPITVTGSPIGKQTSFNLVISGNPMTVSCSPSPTTVLLGEEVTWSASVSGGTGPFTYSWSGTNIPTSPAPSTNPYTLSYGTIGRKTATVTVTDADSVPAICAAPTVQVNFNPQFEEF